MFDYYCRNFGFDSVEINSSFYTMPAAKSMASLARRSPDAFTFMIKAYQAFSHNLGEATQVAFDRFRRGIAPLIESGKARGVLAQFPSSFLPTRRTAQWLKRLRDEFLPLPLFVEFRHRVWDHPKVYDYLQKESIGYCMTDLPDVPPLPRLQPVVTNGTAYVRMHGRNPEWYHPTTSRYDYAYSDTELSTSIAVIEGLSSIPDDVFFFFNNCHGAGAVRSGKRLRELEQQRSMVNLMG